MGMRDYKRTPAHKAEQAARTKKNKSEKYTRLLEKYPDSPHLAKWEKFI